jgi:predicted dehydrogenase
MSDLVRFGLVGCGRIGALGDDRAATWPEELRAAWLPYAHASGIVATAGARLVAVCDAQAAAAEAAKTRFGAERAYTSHREMLAKEKLDVLAIATRTAERPQIILDAVEAGVRGIYSEKPIATTLEDADAVVAAVERRGVAFAYGTRRRFMEGYLRARELVRDGAIGQLQSIVVKFGRGALLWNHPHSVDIASFFADDAAIEWVRADLDPKGFVVEGSVVDCDPIVETGQLKFVGGVHATVLGAAGQDVELHGTEGNLVVTRDGIACTMHTYAKDAGDIAWLMEETEVPIVAPWSGTVRALTELVLTVKGERSPVAHARASLAGLEALFGWVASDLAGGRRVSMPLPRSGTRITGRVGDKFT